MFLLCHNDDVAVATMRTGASARAPSERAWSQQPAENLWITGGGLSGIAGLTSERKQLRRV